MASHSAIPQFTRLIGAAGLGAYLGAAIAGLFALLTGEVFAPSNTWLVALPILAVLGAGIGGLAGWLTRRWLAPRTPRRRLTFVVAGAVALPLATAIGQLHAIDVVGVPLVFAGAIGMVTVYWRAVRAPVRKNGTYSRSGVR
jgi:hypothetical protein